MRPGARASDTAAGRICARFSTMRLETAWNRRHEPREASVMDPDSLNTIGASRRQILVSGLSAGIMSALARVALASFLGVAQLPSALGSGWRDSAGGSCE